jgi:hypothetical protein
MDISKDLIQKPSETDQINQKYLLQLYELEKERIEHQERYKKSIEENEAQFK